MCQILLTIKVVNLGEKKAENGSREGHSEWLHAQGVAGIDDGVYRHCPRHQHHEEQPYPVADVLLCLQTKEDQVWVQCVCVCEMSRLYPLDSSRLWILSL